MIFLENLALYNTKGEVPDGDQVGEIGRAAVVKDGTDITIVAYSAATVVALEVAQRLEQDGHLGRGRRPAQPAAAGPRDDLRLGQQDQPRRRLRGRLARYGIGAEIAATIQEGASTTSTRRSGGSRQPRCRCPTRNRWSWPRCRTPPI